MIKCPRKCGAEIRRVTRIGASGIPPAGDVANSRANFGSRPIVQVQLGAHRSYPAHGGGSGRRRAVGVATLVNKAG